MPEPAVEIEDLRVVHAGSGKETIAVDGLSLTVARGSVTSLLGPNGAGKTSTISVCEGFRRPTAGSVRVLGLDPAAQTKEIRPRIGVMLQDGGAWLGVRAGEMLRYVASLHARPLDPQLLLNRLGLDEHEATEWRRLSGGQKQRLGLAMAVIGRPELVFLDEPTAGLDPQARRATWDLIRELRDAGVSVVLTTHHMDEAQILSDQIHIIDRGRLVATGTPSELLEQSNAGWLIVETGEFADLSELGSDIPAVGDHFLVSPGVHRFEVEGTPELIAAVARWCADQNIDLRAVRAERMTLEERFIELTGAELR